MTMKIFNRILHWWLMTDHKYKMDQNQKAINAIYEKTNSIRQRIATLQSSYGWDKKPIKNTPKAKPELEDIKAKLGKK